MPTDTCALCVYPWDPASLVSVALSTDADKPASASSPNCGRKYHAGPLEQHKAESEQTADTSRQILKDDEARSGLRASSVLQHKTI